MAKEIITYSSGSCLCLCERKYELRYERCLRAKHEESEALVLGSWAHAGLAAYVRLGLGAALAVITDLENATPAIGPDVFRIAGRAAQARAMVRVAAERWPVAPDENALVEQRVEMPIPRSRTFVFCGVVDGIQDGALIDWKTVSDVSGFLDSRTIGYQTELYAAAARETVDTALFRLIVKPTIRMSNRLDGGSSRLYEERCVEWLRAEPGRLVEHEMYLDLGRVAEAREWLRVVGMRILANRRTGCWLRNEQACYNWSRACEYLPICRLEACGHDAGLVIDENYGRVDDPHPELSRAQPPPAAGVTEDAT